MLLDSVHVPPSLKVNCTISLFTLSSAAMIKMKCWVKLLYVACTVKMEEDIKTMCLTMFCLYLYVLPKLWRQKTVEYRTPVLSPRMSNDDIE